MLDERICEKVRQLEVLEKSLPSFLIVHDVRDWSVVYMSKNGLDYLNTTLEEIKAMGADYHQRYFNPEESSEYVPLVMNLLEKNNSDDMIAFFQQVRPTPEHNYTWFLTSVKILCWDEDNKPMLTVSSAIPIDPKHHLAQKVERMIQENSFLRNNLSVYESLSKREKEVLVLMAKGYSAFDIAEKLYISEATASTHRRNIRQKINAKNNYDITYFAQAYNLI